VNWFYKIRPSNLKPVRQGIDNEPGDVAMCLIQSMRQEPLMKVGENFGLDQ
jgi:hypothetical protein